MRFDSPLSILSIWISFSFQVLLAYLISRTICAVIESPRLRTHIWRCFLFLTAARWIYLYFFGNWIPFSSQAHALSLPGKYAQYQSFSLEQSWALHLSGPAKWVWPAYLFIVGLMLLRLLLKSLRLRGLLQTSRLPSAGPQLLFRRICEEMGLRHCKLLLIPELRSPATCGIWRGIVLLPADLVSELNTRQLSHIMRHELIHIGHRDYLWERLAALACRVVFFHPMVWIVHRHLRWDRELACDRSVIQIGEQGRVQYAECLVKLARWSYSTTATSDGIGFSSSSSLLTKRVTAVLHAPRPNSVFERALRVSIVLALATIALFVLPACNFTLSLRVPPAISQISSLALHKGATRRRVKRITAQPQRPSLKQEPALPAESAKLKVPLDLLASYRTPALPILVDSPNQRTSALESESGERPGEYQGKATWDEAQVPGHPSTNWGKLVVRAVTSAVAGIAGGDQDREDPRGPINDRK